MVVLLAAGHLFAGGGRDRDDDRLRVGVSLGPQNNAWHVRLRQVVDAAVLNHPDIHWDVRNAANVADQQHMLETFMAMGFDAIVIMPTDGVLLAPIAAAIYHSGIPTVVFNRDIASPHRTAFVAGDNFGGGVNAARLIGERLGGEGDIVVLRSMTGTPIDMDRFTGFYSTLTRDFPNIRILTQADGQFNREAGLNAMTGILPGFPRIDAVVTQDDEAALGALTAIQNAGRTDIRYITGFGGTLPTFEIFQNQAANPAALNARPLYLASMSYFPSMGFDAIEMAVRILRGIPFSRETILASQVVGSWNVQEFMDDAY